MTTRDGVSYRFDVYIERAIPTVTSGTESNARKAVFLLASEVTDRYGNWVRYFYNGNGHPTSITASDGRAITLTYVQSRLQSASITLSVPAETRTWTYGYTQQPDTLQRLTSVTLPDNVSTWQFDYQSLNPPSPFTYLYVTYLAPKPSGSECLPPEISTPGGDFGLRITHPSGATGDFRFKLERSDRYNFSASNCQIQPGGGGKYIVAPYIDAFRLKSKTISDTGASSQLWSYSYAPLNDDRHVRTTVTQPDGSLVRNDFSAVYGATTAGAPAGSAIEGQLVAMATIQNGITLRTQANTYVTGPDTAFAPLAGYVFPSRYGGGAGGDDSASGSVRPLLSTTITLPQQGVTLTRTHETFDAMARPLRVKRESRLLSSSAVLHSKTETTAYDDKRGIWVLDLVDTVTNSTLPSVPQVDTDYDPIGNPTRSTVFGRQQNTMTWRPDGTLETLTIGPNTTTLGTFKRGVPQGVTYADNTSISAAVDDAGDIRSVTDENSFTTIYGYDKLRRLTGITYPAGDTVNWLPTSIQYDFVTNDPAAGFTGAHWRQTTSIGNARLVAHYDQRMRPRLTAEYDITAQAVTERYTRRGYDYANRETFVSFAASSASASAGTTTTYDALGRITGTTQDSELGTLTTSTVYTSPFKTQFTNARGKTTSMTFQVFDEPSDSAPLTIEEPLATTTTFTRDVFGKPLTMTRSGTYNGNALSVTRRYVYDQNQLLCKTIEPESGATVFSYNALNLVEWKASGQGLTDPAACQRELVAANQKVNYDYDQRDRLWRTRFGDSSPDIVVTYTPDGLPRTVTSDNSLWTTDYNKRRLMISETLQLNGTSSYALGYTHTPNGHVSALTYPDNSSVAYAPNALGQATQVGNYASQISWYPNGGLKSLRYGNTIAHSTEQNLRGLPSRSLDAGVLNDRYVYDENANVKDIVDDLSGAFSRTMLYDDRGRLTDATNAPLWAGTHSFIYDPLDNLRRSINPAFGDWSFVYNGTTQRLDRIEATAGGTSLVTYGYDTRGRATARATTGAAQTFAVDLADRVTAVNPATATYRYDGHGRRTSITKSGVTAVQVYSQAGQLMYQSSPASDGIFRSGFQTSDTPYSAATGGTKRYIYLGRHLIAEDGTAGRQYLHTDALGSPVRTTNASGAPSARNDYKPYGWGPSPQSTPSFTGHVADAETGLIYMQARYYDPFAGRFLATDPNAASASSFNRYWYANNNPYKFVDPDGREGCAASRIAAVCERYGMSNATAAIAKEGTKQAARGVETIAGLTGAGGAATSAYELVTGRSPLSGDEASRFWAAVGLIPYAKNLRYFGKVSGAAKGKLAEARAARDALSAELAPLKGKAPATVTAGYNVKTGEVAARACGDGKCAENHVVDALGGVKGDVRFTEAVRPRTGVEVPVCPRCEATFGRDSFPQNTRFKTDE
ncbi:MAG: hypothetical protein JNN30_06365 [Rhodanobacteraceae bacterium]|nr:hypothetical protein [Rhodanobacteraceae bacterium]